MNLRPSKFKVPMLTAAGDSAQYQERNGYTFTITGQGDPYMIAVEAFPRHCNVSDYRTGMKISHECTPNPQEAAQGVWDMFKTGALDIGKIRELTQNTPTINEAAQ